MGFGKKGCGGISYVRNVLLNYCKRTTAIKQTHPKNSCEISTDANDVKNDRKENYNNKYIFFEGYYSICPHVLIMAGPV